MSQYSSTFVTAFARLFQSREDVYAEGYPDHNRPGKYAYAKQTRPLTEDVLREHLSGFQIVGVYPIRDGHVSWFAIDFDAPKDEAKQLIPDAVQIAHTEARAVQQLLEAKGFIVYLERSRSGLGFHLWGFLEAPVSAELVFYTLKSLLPDGVSFDRFFPTQPNAVRGKGLGNLIALPFYGSAIDDGNSIFLDRDDAVIPPEVFLERVVRNEPVLFERVAMAAQARHGVNARGERANDVFAAPHGVEADFAGRPERPITGVLKLLSDYGCRFMRHAWVNRRTLPETQWWVALSQLTCFEHGREAAHILSRDYANYSADETNAKYDNLLANPPHGCQYIHTHFPKFACTGCPMKAPYHVAQKPILELVQESSAPMRRATFARQLERIRARNTGVETPGVSWGIPGFDQFTRLRKSELTVVGAMPSIGKTALMIDAMISIAEQGIPVMGFSAETAEGGLFDRMLAHVSGIDSRALRGERTHPVSGIPWPLTAAEWETLEQARQHLETLPLYVNFTDINADQVLRNIERVVLEQGISFDAPYVVFFDYLQFGAKLSHESNYDRVSRLSTEFKNIAKIIRNPVVIFSQLVRDAEGMEAPSLTMFKESGRIEQDADVAMILSGERVKGRRAPRRVTGVKQREGESQFAIDFVLQQDVCRFTLRSGAEGGAADKPDLLATDRPTLFGEEIG